jgi:hypothetical protein
MSEQPAVEFCLGKLPNFSSSNLFSINRKGYDFSSLPSDVSNNNEIKSQKQSTSSRRETTEVFTPNEVNKFSSNIGGRSKRRHRKSKRNHKSLRM